MKYCICLETGYDSKSLILLPTFSHTFFYTHFTSKYLFSECAIMYPLYKGYILDLLHTQLKMPNLTAISYSLCG